jgi:hypothetical protein
MIIRICNKNDAHNVGYNVAYNVAAKGSYKSERTKLVNFLIFYHT